jgi:hypothetical protein
MKVEIDVENTEALEQICKESNRNPSEIVNAFFKALHDTVDTAAGRVWFGDASFDQVLDCILNNLAVGPKIIEDTTKGFLIKEHMKSKIDQLEVDFEKRTFWYDLINFEDKRDPIMIKVEIGNGRILLSRSSAVPVPATAVKDLHKRVREATQLGNKLIQDKYTNEILQLPTLDVKLSIISADMTPCFVAIALTVTTEDRKYLPTLDMLDFLIRQIASIVWECLQL